MVYTKVFTEEKIRNIKINGSKIRAINHKLRQRILIFLLESRAKGFDSKSVTDVYVTLRLKSESVTSQHLGILKRAGYVVSKKIGKNVYYSINQDGLDWALNLK